MHESGIAGHGKNSSSIKDSDFREIICDVGGRNWAME
jgi:hypothetical protein